MWRGALVEINDERASTGEVTLQVRNFGPIQNASVRLADYNILVALNNLGAVYYAKGQWTQAETLYCRSLAIKEKLLALEKR